MDVARAAEPVFISDEDRLKMKRLGLAHWRAGQLKEAAQYFGVVLSLDPQDAEVLCFAGKVAGQQGHREEAITLLQMAVELGPTSARHNDLGLALACLGRHGEAVGHFNKSFALDDKNWSALNNMGISLVGMQRFELAEAAYKAALDICPDDPRLSTNYVSLLRNRGRHDEVPALLEAAIARIAPEDSLTLRGVLARAQGDYLEALELYQARRTAKPDDHANLKEMGLTLQMLDRATEAEALFRAVADARPENPESHAMLCGILFELGHLDEALERIDRAVALAPHEADLRYQRAHILISMGRYQEGWAAYDARLQGRQADNRQRMWNDWAPWSGEPIADRTMLVVTEQGMGDTIQFLRYLPVLAKRAGRLLVYTYAPTVKLIAEMPGVAEVVAFGDPIPDHDVHAHIMSLPGAFGTSLETVPSDIYIVPGPDQAERWRRQVEAALLGCGPGLRVGVVWAGNPGFGNDRRRSMPFAMLAPLFRVPGIHWFSLQVGTRDADPGQADPGLLPPGGLHALLEGVPDLTETAGLLANLDLVLAVDTAVAHLAGAMGRPVWLMVPAAADWRWMRDRDTTPWYPTMRLFRQGEDCAWLPVAERMAAALGELAAAALESV